MTLTLIAAVSENNVIGNKGVIPWRISEDMKRFKALTMGHPVIMGRKTFDSIPAKFKPLPGRTNVVVTRNRNFNYEGIEIAHSIEDAILRAKKYGDLSYVAGGEEIYAHTIGLADAMEITHVRGNYNGDAFFPDISAEKWREVMRDDFDGYSFVTYERK